jgi:TonB family protein
MTRSKTLAAVVFVVLSTSATVVAQAPIAGQAPVRVGGVVRAPQKIRDVQPVYPSLAQAAGVEGVVIVELLIAPDGHVERSRILKSVALLDQAALDAVNQWAFTPTLLNGVAVPILYNVTVTFQLRNASTAPTLPPLNLPAERVRALPRWDPSTWSEPQLPAGHAIRIAETWIKQQRPGVELQLTDVALRAVTVSDVGPVWFYVTTFGVRSVAGQPLSPTDARSAVAVVLLDGSVVEPR